MYVVARDFGFAPNPFHGVCTLATCKPKIRGSARIGDWVVGMGGVDLRATGRMIFAMIVEETLTFDQYWGDARFIEKRPVRNGSGKMLVGDNIYHRKEPFGEWVQADSHHSLDDGRPNKHNLKRDTGVDRVLCSKKFWYFGERAPEVPQNVLAAIAYRNCRSHRRITLPDARPLIDWLTVSYSAQRGMVVGDPVDFARSNLRYDAGRDRVAKHP